MLDINRSATDLSLRTSLDDEVKNRLQGHHQLTDFHLAALAFHQSGYLVTLDDRLQRVLADTRLAAAISHVTR